MYDVSGCFRGYLSSSSFSHIARQCLLNNQELVLLEGNSFLEEMESRPFIRLSQRLKLRSNFRRSQAHLNRQRFSSDANEQKSSSARQAIPIGDYYALLLETDVPAISNKPSRAATESARKTASIIFASRIVSPAQRREDLRSKSTLIGGVWVPPKPGEPDNCCMSGCVNCVWDQYRDDVEVWAAAKRQADVALRKDMSFEKGRKRRAKTPVEGATGLMLGNGEKDAQHTMISMDDDGGGSESNWKDVNVLSNDDLFKGLPVGILEFMKTEKRLKDKHAMEGSPGS